MQKPGIARTAVMGVSMAQPSMGEEKAKSAEPPSFERLSLVLLMRGPNAKEIPEDQLAEIQKQHLAHLKVMGESGRMVVAGPFGEQGDESFRGLCLYRLPVDEARRLAEADPAVKAGRLRVEVMSWYYKAGHIAFPLVPKVDAAASD